MKGIKTITISQRNIKKMQRQIRQHKDELHVHYCHLLDIRSELEGIIRHVAQAMCKLDDAAKALKS